jgi:hypothetical protein
MHGGEYGAASNLAASAAVANDSSNGSPRQTLSAWRNPRRLKLNEVMGMVSMGQ